MFRVEDLMSADLEAEAEAEQWKSLYEVSQGEGLGLRVWGLGFRVWGGCSESSNWRHSFARSEKKL